MDLKLTPEQAARSERFNQFDMAEQAFEAARKEAKSSREALYYALSAAYYWYLKIKHDFTLLTDKLNANEPKIKWSGCPKDPKKPSDPWTAEDNDDPNIPRDPFTPIIKLVFGFESRKHASTVTMYAKCLRFVDREIHDSARFTGVYEPHIDNPELAKNIIEAAGGVVTCAEEQHKYENPTPSKDATAEQLEEYWSGECQKIYESREPLGSVDVKSGAPIGSFMLMMGRVAQDGSVEVIETLERSPSEIFAIAESEAFKDVSKLSPTLNLLADSLGFLSLFKAGEHPIVSVEKGGTALHISLDKSHSASMVLRAVAKQEGTLSGFAERAYLAPQDWAWFCENAQAHKYRHIYEMSAAHAEGAITAYDLSSRISGKAKTIHFNKMAKTAEKQVALDSSNSSKWDFEFSVDRAAALNLYMGWLQEWTQEFKHHDKKTAKDRVVVVEFDKSGISLASEFSRDPGGVALPTNINSGRSYELLLSGHEFAAVLKQFLTLPDLEEFTLRGLETGVLEVESENALAKFIVDIPALTGDGSRYVDKHFAKLV